jgi:ribosomal protein S18 acetylase RimI-like enzyme
MKLDLTAGLGLAGADICVDHELTITPQLDVLDLRHFSAAQLRPLLEDEARRWNERLRWDYTRSTEILLEYLESHVLQGFAAMHEGRVQGYTFSVYEAAKAVIGDVYAFNEGEGQANPFCETLLLHLIEMLQATPGIERIESQLLMFPSGALAAPFLSRGFRAFPRLFMGCVLPSVSPGAARAETRLPAGLRLVPWREDFYAAAGESIHRAYATHVDSEINDQYRSVHGSMRFLHNIVRFPGCGIFDAGNSWVLRDERGLVQGLLLCSQVRPDVGHITQLCVAPELRGQGLGRALLHRCAAEFVRRGFRGISLTVTEQNVEARRLYEDYGFMALHHFDAMVWDKRRD